MVIVLMVNTLKKQYKLDGVKVIKLPKLEDKRGSLSFFENDNQIPFKIKRSYWICGIPQGEFRGSHAFRENKEFIIALSTPPMLKVKSSEPLIS